MKKSEKGKSGPSVGLPTISSPSLGFARTPNEWWKCEDILGKMEPRALNQELVDTINDELKGITRLMDKDAYDHATNRRCHGLWKRITERESLT